MLLLFVETCQVLRERAESSESAQWVHPVFGGSQCSRSEVLFWRRPRSYKCMITVLHFSL